MQSFSSSLSRIFSPVRTGAFRAWTWFRSRVLWQQILIGIIILGVLGGGVALASRTNDTDETVQARTVTLASVSSLSGNSVGTSIVGSVRSVTEAELHAESGGTVKSVHTTLGARVPAGFVIADLDNASEAASVLQAEGAYDSAIAARSAQSLPDTRNTAREAYQSAYTSIDTTLENDVDQFFGRPTATGPQLLINEGPSHDLGRERQALDTRMSAWQAHLASASSADPAILLDQAITDTQAVSSFLVELSTAANDRGARTSEAQTAAEPAQTAALASARATVDATLSKLTAARSGLRTGTVSATASSDASIKSALGTLRAAQANYEKTRVRATIGGTVNFLPIQVGQYVAAFEHVATVANNGALEIVAYVPEETRSALAVGMKVQVEGNHIGTVTEVAPALDPVTKQVEVHVAVDATPDLINGQSVRITLASAGASAPAKTAAAATTTPTTAGALLPLTAVKLLADSRAVFTVDANGRVVAHTVTIGDVVGDRIQITSGLTPDMRIITDVRGLSEGEKVTVDESSS